MTMRKPSQWLRLFVLSGAVLSAAFGARPASSGEAPNRVTNGSFEVGLNGWLMLENWVVDAQWNSVADKDAPHGRRVLHVDWREATTLTNVPAQCLLMGPWFRHGESALVVSAMIRSDTERTITVGFTHGSAFRRIGHEEERTVGPDWRPVTVLVPRNYNIHRPNKVWGARSPLRDVSATAGCVYFNLQEKGAYWFDAVQVREVEASPGAESPEFTPATEVELGWSVEGSGVSRQRPRFQIALAHHGREAVWKGALRCRISDYFGAEIQDETFALELKPEDRYAHEVDVRSDRLGYFRVDLSVADALGKAVATDTLSLVRAREGRGGDAIAVGASQSRNSHVDQMAVLSRLGFRQTRLYNCVNWADMERKKGVWAPIHSYMERFMGDSGMEMQVNIAKLPKWLLGRRSMHSHPLGALDGYSNYARWTLEQIRPWVSAVSYVNEPNAHYASPVENYVAYQRALYEAVQAVAPEVDVVGIQAGSGSQGGGLVNYTEDMLRAGGEPLVEAMDVLAIQTHPTASLPFEIWGWDQVLARLREVAKAHGIERLWSTEMSYLAFPPDESLRPFRGGIERRKNARPSERNQADWLTRATLYSLSSTFERVYPFLYNPMSHGGGYYWSWGLTKPNYAYTPRPALVALATANHLIAGLDEKEALAFVTPASLWGGVFAGKDRRLDAVWSAVGPQDVMIDPTGDLELYDAMGNPLAVAAGDPPIFELGESPVYCVGAKTEASPVHEFLAVTWNPDDVWSHSSLKGTALFMGLERHPVPVDSLQIAEEETGRNLLSLDVRKTLPPGKTMELEWALPLDAPAGRYSLVMEARLDDGRRFRRRFAPMVLGAISERERFFKGEPWVIDDFTESIQGTASVPSQAGGRWETQLTFPWFQLDAPNAERAIEAKDGFLRGVVTSKVGNVVRGKPGWIKLECRFDKPINWLAFQGLRIRYRLDRPDDQGALRMDNDLAAKGVHVTLLDAEENLFHTTAGHPGLEFRRDGDWYVAELSFDAVHALDEKRAKITTLMIVAGPPAQDEDSFGLSLDTVECFAQPGGVEAPKEQGADLHAMPLFDE
jgi:hypothetical protein